MWSVNLKIGPYICVLNFLMSWCIFIVANLIRGKRELLSWFLVVLTFHEGKTSKSRRYGKRPCWPTWITIISSGFTTLGLKSHRQIGNRTSIRRPFPLPHASLAQWTWSLVLEFYHGHDTNQYLMYHSQGPVQGKRWSHSFAAATVEPVDGRRRRRCVAWQRSGTSPPRLTSIVIPFDSRSCEELVQLHQLEPQTTDAKAEELRDVLRAIRKGLDLLFQKTPMITAKKRTVQLGDAFK